MSPASGEWAPPGRTQESVGNTRESFVEERASFVAPRANDRPGRSLFARKLARVPNERSSVPDGWRKAPHMQARPSPNRAKKSARRVSLIDERTKKPGRRS